MTEINPCPDCGQVPTFGPMRSAAGWYWGSRCGCGPNSRETGYYSTRGEVELAAATDTLSWVDRAGEWHTPGVCEFKVDGLVEAYLRAQDNRPDPCE